jgi:DNA-binding XRE family transcriptional regulator
MSIHISTKETFMAGAVEYTGFCPVCCRPDALIKQGYLEGFCESCKRYHNTEELQRTVKQRRELLGLTRRQMADEVGVKPVTIGNYERNWPSKTYWEQTRQMMLKKLAEENSAE